MPESVPVRCIEYTLVGRARESWVGSCLESVRPVSGCRDPTLCLSREDTCIYTDSILLDL